MLEVKRVAQLSPHMRRITLTGAALADFRSDAADDGSRLYFPPDPHDSSWVPVVKGTTLVFPADSPRPPGREYTPRRYDPVAGELDFDFVVHSDGPASTWAAHAQPGHLLGQSGPRRSRLVVGAVDGYVLAGDETGLPAIARRLEELPAGMPVTVVVEVANAAEELPLPTAADLRLLWVHRDETGPNPTELLARTIRSLDLPAGNLFAWASGETGSITAVRRHLLRERELPSEWMRMTGYWKRAIANWDHHQPFDE